MARQNSKKRRFLGFGKRRSASNLPSASAQDAGSAAEISGGTFRRRLATVRRLFGRLNRSQPVSGPSEVVDASAGGAAQVQQGQSRWVPPQDVNEAVSDGAEPQPASATAGKSVKDAVQQFDDLHPISRLGEGAIKLVTFADTPYINIQNVEGYIKPFEVFNGVITTLSKVHPYAQIALGVLVLAAQVFIGQANLDKAVFDLLQTVRRVYEFLAEEDTINNIDQMKDTLTKIARVISDSAQFIKNYSETKSFWKRTLKNVHSETQNIVNDYTTTLNDLMQQYRDRTTRDIQINMYRVLENLNLDGMAYAGGAGLDTTKACLNGTRTEVLRHIADWIESRVDPHRIMWLHGQAGRGKSAIAHTIAMWVKDSGGLGSCFCFERDRLAERREEKMLTTIARDLADRDPAFRRALANIVSKDHSLKATRDVTQQWRRLLLGPLSEVNTESIGNVVVVIDALDESGPEASRSCILSLLTSQEAAHLPTNFRILITSRLLPDIVGAFNSCQHVTVTSLDDVPLASAAHDISLFVSNELRHRNLEGVIGPNEIDQITQKSDGLFEWARLACEFIKWKRAGRSLRERFNDVITLGSGEGSTLLDRTYATILETAIPSKDRISLPRIHSVMQQILTTLVPLPMATLQHMREYFPNEKDRYDVVDILEFMAPVLGGINDSCPVHPLHASFYDFLTDQSRSGDYFIDTSRPYNLAFASLHILCKELQFNLCRLESSYLNNSEVPNLQQRMNKYIASHLSYSCQFWAQHLQKTAFDSALAKLVAAIVGSEKFMFWLETLSIIGELGQAVDALVHAVAWLQGQVGFEDALEMIQDEIKFIHHFGSAISHSTPHLYVSALPLAPSKSRLSKMLLPRFCNLIGVAVGGLKEWTTTLLALEGHANEVNAVAFSPDGRRIVSGSNDNTVRLWDVGGCIWTLQGHTDWVRSVAFSPDGKRIVSGSDDKTVRVWDVERGVQCGSPLQGHTHRVHSVAFSSDGKRIVSGSGDMTVRVWDAGGGMQIGHPLQGHVGVVQSVAFSPDGQRIASGSDDTSVRVWDAEHGMQLGRPLLGHAGRVLSVGFAPDGRRIVSSATDRTIRVWDSEEGVQIGNPLNGHTDWVISVVFSPGGNRIASASADTTVRVWDVEAGRQVGSPFQGHTHRIRSVAFSPDGKRIVSGSEDKTVRVWDAEGCAQPGSTVQGHIVEILDGYMARYYPVT